MQAWTPPTPVNAPLLLATVLDDPSHAGAIGLLAFAVAVLGPFALSTYRWQVRRGDRAEAKVDEMQIYLREKVVPALIDSASAQRASAESNRMAADAARDVAALMRDLSRGSGVK